VSKTKFTSEKLKEASEQFFHLLSRLVSHNGEPVQTRIQINGRLFGCDNHIGEGRIFQGEDYLGWKGGMEKRAI
jgi:hypothetical protein